MEFGKRLCELRRRQGLSQEALAERLGVTRQAVSKWETGESLPDIDRLIALSEVFCVSTDYLVKGTEPQASAAPEPAAPAAPAAAPECRPRIEKLAQLVVGWVLTGVGALGFIIVWVLSTMIVTYRQVTSAAPGAGGAYDVWEVPEYTLGGFISQYNLEALLTVCGVLLAVGAGLLIRRWYQLRKPLDPDEREPLF